ncbi:MULTISPECIES: YeeE/YedE thiosulfate transporter family protein [unclassified Fusibacter]|uniref:YeeE/YedE thiosulfate transporter family protein n=1 Tax=unclassified Fusibacter TaxID=2624464 RepID=UPI001010AA2C|nr:MULTISPECIES: YeeE/YedE thiosulfate transporter family protein [unclassified Fusibacter]MCK8058179.1 YeeE/YedE family protein [Fusibacter sp. A2]NPE20762.1 YeeE/YedE family protein [Fusibacter sp. A1]RXV62969.1 transporter [Fusibacter sp. A1]
MSESTGTSSIRRSSSRAPRKPKPNQIPFGFLLAVLMIAVAVGLATKSAMMVFFWITGIAFGFILQRARFCFTASMRDPYLTGGTALTRAVIVALILTTIGFTAIKYGYFSQGLPIPGMSYVVPISFATLAGAFMFGIGMVIAGGCASGTLMRVGEGFAMNVISLIFFIVGSLWGANNFEFWKFNFISKGKAVFLPDVFGWLGAVVVQLTVLALLYVAAVKYEKKRSQSTENQGGTNNEGSSIRMFWRSVSSTISKGTKSN